MPDQPGAARILYRGQRCDGGGESAALPQPRGERRHCIRRAVVPFNADNCRGGWHGVWSVPAAARVGHGGLLGQGRAMRLRRAPRQQGPLRRVATAARGEDDDGGSAHASGVTFLLGLDEAVPRAALLDSRAAAAAAGGERGHPGRRGRLLLHHRLRQVRHRGQPALGPGAVHHAAASGLPRRRGGPTPHRHPTPPNPNPNPNPKPNPNPNRTPNPNPNPNPNL